jgi:hypothetical protein
MAVTTYQNFDLLITRSGDDYRAFVVDAPGGDADATFALPFTADELDFLGNLAGVRRGGTGGSGAGSVSDLKELGSLLYGAVIQGKVAAVLATSLEKAEQENVGLRLRLRFSEETAELATLPWEILYDPVQEHFLALSESSPILRYLSLPKARPTLLVKPPLRLLTVLASPPGYEELDLEREWQVLEKAMGSLIADDKFVLDRLEHPTFAALQERLLGEDIHILHFVGHGVYDEAAGAGALVLTDTEGNAQEVSGEELATLLHNHRSLRLVYLNACEGALSSHLNVFSGVAQTLVQQGVPAAVAMQAEISDEAAIDLSRLFYSALAAGYPVDAALTQARVAIAARSAEWAIPVLFSRSPDNRLFDVVEVLPAPDCPYPGMVPFSEKQADVFFGRDKEIGDAIERLRQHPFLTVIGPSGSGKSSLVYAGVIPALRTSKRFGAGEWDVTILRPGAKPLTALSEALAASPEQLASEIFNQRTLLFVDQFEELFTLAEASEAQRFLDTLNGLIGKPNLYILLTVRADFYPDLMASSFWQPIRANRLELTPLGDEELRAAILQPAAQVGVTIDEVLVERLVADAAGESGALPLVQETLVLLWEKVEKRHLALNAYTDMADGKRNGLQVAIDRRATVVYENLPDDAKSMARRIFLRLIQFGEGRADTRRQQTVAELRASSDDPALFDRTLATLTASRLLTTSGEEGGSRRVDVSHEALIGGWALLQKWLKQWKEDEIGRRRLMDKHNEWDRMGRSQGGLLDAQELTEAEAWIQSPQAAELGYHADLIDFISSSRRVVDERRQKELRTARLRHRLLWIGTTISACILIGLFLVGLDLFNNWSLNRAWTTDDTVPTATILTIADQGERLALGSAHLGVALRDSNGRWSGWLRTGLPTGNQATESVDPSANVRDVRAIRFDPLAPNRPYVYVPTAGIYQADAIGEGWSLVGPKLPLVSEGTIPLAAYDGIVLFIPDEPGLFAQDRRSDYPITADWVNLADIAPELRGKWNAVIFAEDGTPLVGGERGLYRGEGFYPYTWRPILLEQVVEQIAVGKGGDLFVVVSQFGKSMYQLGKSAMFCVNSAGEQIGPTLPYLGGNWFVDRLFNPHIDAVVAHPVDPDTFFFVTISGDVFQVACDGRQHKIGQGSLLSASNDLAIASNGQGDYFMYFVNGGGVRVLKIP